MITSPANEQVKRIRRLQERKERERTGLFFLEGIRIVAEAAERGEAFETLIVSPDRLQSDFAWKLVENLRRNGTPILEVSSLVFERLSQKEGPQGIAAVVHQRWMPLGAVSVENGKPWVALDSVADPGNLGTILRTLDAVGGAGVILLDQSTDPYDPSCVRASMGALFDLHLVRTSFEQFRDWMKRQTGVALIGTSGAAKQDYHDFPYPSRLVLLMGSERLGLQPYHLELCDEVVRIPMVGRSDSLNLAVATAVVLYEIFNQQRQKSLGVMP